jgi:hypothetical protein
MPIIDPISIVAKYIVNSVSACAVAHANELTVIIPSTLHTSIIAYTN